MLKDIYSPLEIDEQWDQRAPMIEGDSVANMRYDAPDAGGTAVMDKPSVETSIAPTSTEAPVSMSEPVETGATDGEVKIEPATQPENSFAKQIPASEVTTDETKISEPETSTDKDSPQASEDHAAALLEGMNADKDTETESTTQQGSEDKLIEPVVKFEPSEPRIQPDGSDEEENSHGIVSTDDHDKGELMPNLDDISNEPKNSETLDNKETVESDVIAKVDEEIKSALDELRGELGRLDESIGDEEKTISEAETNKSKLVSQKEAVQAKIEALEKV